MDFYNEIVNKSEEEIEKIVRDRISTLEKSKKDEEENILGYKVDCNHQYYSIDAEDNEKSFSIDLRCFYHGYIKKGSKIVYGLKYNNEGLAGNDGNYYYVEDDTYIYEFIKFIKDIEIEDEYEMMSYILEFLRKYFGTIKRSSRSDMHKLIYKDDYNFYLPIKKHDLTDFKGKGSALCSEYAVMAQNLMSILGIDSYIVIGNEDVGDGKNENHAFNIVEINNQSDTKTSYLADFTNYVSVFDEDFHLIEVTPFLGKIEELTDEFIEDLVYREKKLEYEDYAYIYIGDIIAKLAYTRNRTYYIDTYIHPDKNIEKINRK